MIKKRQVIVLIALVSVIGGSIMCLKTNKSCTGDIKDEVVKENLDTIRNYVNAEEMSALAGTITYLYTLDQIAGQVFGGLGIDNDYEFDGIWNSYSPKDYKKAFRYIVEYIRNNKEYNKTKDNLVSVIGIREGPFS